MRYIVLVLVLLAACSSGYDLQVDCAKEKDLVKVTAFVTASGSQHTAHRGLVTFETKDQPLQFDIISARGGKTDSAFRFFPSTTK